MNRKDRGRQLEELLADATDVLSKQLQVGINERFVELLKFYANNFHRYSVNNTFLIQIQLPHASYCAGLRRWNELGYTVRPGEKALWVLAPRFVKRENPDTGKEEQRMIGYVAVPVFDASQVEGGHALPAIRLDVEGDFATLYQALKKAAEDNGISVTESALSDALAGYAKRKEIHLHERLTDSQKFMTCIHEVAHALLHFEALPDSRATAELEAEATVFTLCHILGIESEASSSYIKVWRGDAESLKRSMQNIHKAVKTIYGWLEAAKVIELVK